MADLYRAFRRTPERVRPGNSSLVPTQLVGSAPRRISYDEAKDNAYSNPRRFEKVVNNMMTLLN